MNTEQSPLCRLKPRLSIHTHRTSTRSCFMPRPKLTAISTGGLRRLNQLGFFNFLKEHIVFIIYFLHLTVPSVPWTVFKKMWTIFISKI